MQSLFAEYGSYGISVSMIILVIVGGFKWRWTWIYGLCSQVYWSAWIYASGEYGFIIMNAFMYVAYTFFHIRWEKERKNASSEKQQLRAEMADA